LFNLQERNKDNETEGYQEQYDRSGEWAYYVPFSYETPVAAHISGKGHFKTEKKWSKTTSKHISEWLRIMGAHECEVQPQDFFDSLTK